VSAVTAKTSLSPEESVTAPIDRMAPGASISQPPVNCELFYHREWSVNIPKTTALPALFVAALIRWKEPTESKSSWAGVIGGSGIPIVRVPQNTRKSLFTHPLRQVRGSKNAERDFS
jgi:hypothetical protein